MAWLYVPGLVDSNLESTLPSERDIELFVMSSGTPTPRRLSWRGWKTRSWIRRLSGTILNPSMAARGVDSWKLSVAATRANLSARPGSDLQSAIRGTCGPIFDALSAKYSRAGASSKTLQTTFAWDLNPSGMTYEEWATELKQDCSRRRKLARPMSASGCSSWPTVMAGSATRTAQGGIQLVQEAENWPPPNANPDAPNMGRRRENGRIANRTTEQCLGKRAGEWPTPKAMTGGANSNRENRAGTGGPDLQEAAVLWPTPQAHDAQIGKTPEQVAAMREKGYGVRNLNEAGEQWQTPAATQHPSRRQVGKAEMGLDQQARIWSTPRAADSAGVAYQRDHGEKGKERAALTGQAQSWATPMAMDGVKPSSGSRMVSDLSHQAQGMKWRGPKHSAQTIGLPPLYRILLLCEGFRERVKRRLNPYFIEWLMGWPIGWTGCGAVEMGLFQVWRRRHLFVLRRGLELELASTLDS